MSSARRVLAVIAAASLALSLSAAPPAVSTARAASLAPPVVRRADAFDVSAPLRLLPPVRPPFAEGGVFEPELPDRPDIGRQPADPARQATAPSGLMPAPSITFEGQKDADNFPFLVEPPDPNIDVGPNDVVQTVNITLAVYDKQGNIKLGPLNINTLWQDFGGGQPVTPVCASSNVGDPIVQYDRQANRWLISQFAFAGGAAFQPVGPDYECIAISTTGDPTGSYNRYEFKISDTLFDDYPHFGVWPDAYYMSINQFDETELFEYAGPGAVAFERAKMIAGDPLARMVYFDLSSSLGQKYGGELPSDLDGTTLPPGGAPNTFIEPDDDVSGFATDRLSAFDFHVDWASPSSSTFTGPSVLNVTAFDSVVPCTDADGDGAPRNCVPEKGGPGLDAISDRMMYRAAYRNISGHEALVLNHTVDTNDPEGRTGIRWYELRKSATTPWSIFQQGTYAPDTRHRWMGSAAMDKAGNIAIGFSISSATTYPSISYAGRLAADPAGQLAQGEASMFAGSGSEDVDGGGRWGDYTSLVLDPSNDCTFWYTNEYYETTTSFDWHTRIGSFTFPGCLGSGADMGVTTATNPPPVLVGQTLTWTLTVANNGPSSAPNAVVVDTLPGGVAFLSSATTVGKCSGTVTVTCKLGTMARGASATVTLKARAPSTPATLTNKATVSAQRSDPNPANNTSTSVLKVLDTCTPPGAPVSTDTTDNPPNVSPVPETDIRSLYTGEPHQADGVARLVFTLSVGSPGSATLPPSSQWYVIWNRPTADATFDRNYVAMKTNAASIATFEYGKISPPSVNLPTRLGTADSGSYDPATGTITISIATSNVDGVSAGSVLSGVEPRTFFSRVDGGPVSQLQTTDFGPSGTYYMVGNC
jgi:uncharacterized repeat protein (TIGR01451 family)